MKIYLLPVLLFCSVIANAQNPCDTINMPIPEGWINNCYPLLNFFGGVSGYITGLNADGHPQQANYFDLSATSYNYLLGTMVRFSKANSQNPESFAKMLYFRVFEDSSGFPGKEITMPLTQGQASLASIKSDVDAGAITGINFPSPIPLPASKKFYVSVDVSNFDWDGTDGRDSICIYATGDNQTTNTGWTYNFDEWIPYPQYWLTPPADIEPLDVSLYIFPYVGTAATGCAVLPVTLVSFTAQHNNQDVILNWEVADELNMKGYEVEKAGSNGVYTNITYVPAKNSTKVQKYLFTDVNAFTNSNAVLYRLKEIDNDGSFKYSKTISVQYNGANIAFQNPFTGTLNMRVNLATPQTVSIKLYNIQGKLIAEEQPALYNASANNISINKTGTLAPGTYFLRMKIGDQQLSYKIIKQ